MRTTGWVLVAAMIGLAGQVAGHESGCTQCNGGISIGQTAGWSLDVEACRTPPGYCLAPGCCEYSRHCCDNAWAGYCQHRAKVDAFWSRVGGPKSCCRAAACCQPLPAPCNECPAATVQPTPAVPPASISPVPMPAATTKANERVRDPRMR